MSRRTISFEEDVPDGDDEDAIRTRHLNADAVTHLRNVEAELTWVTTGLYLLSLAVGGFLFLQFVWWQALIGMVALLVVVTVLLPWPAQGASVGSLTETYGFAFDEKDDVIAQFDRASLEYLTHVDERSGIFFDTEHTFHLIPSSIDGITRTRRTNRLRALAAAGLAVLGSAGVAALSLPTAAMVLPGFLLLYAAVLWIAEPDDVLVVRFTNGETQTFETATEEANDLLSAFRERPGGDVRVIEVEEGHDAGDVVHRLRRLLDGGPPPTHHVNVDNVALVSRVGNRLRHAGAAAVVLAGLAVAAAVWWAVPPWQAALAGIGAAGWLYVRLSAADGATVRTNAGRYYVGDAQVESVIDRFRDRTHGRIEVRGTATTWLTRTDYDHLVVPARIVSLRLGRSYRPILRAFGVGAVTLIVLLALGSVTLPGPEAVESVLTLGLVGAVAWAAVEVLRQLLFVGVWATFQDGESEPYELSRSDGRDFAARFAELDRVVEADLLTRGWWAGSRAINAAGIATFSVERRTRTRRGLFLLGTVAAAVGVLVWGGSLVVGSSITSLPGPIPAAVGVAVVVLVALLVVTWPRESVESTTINGRRLSLDTVDAEAFEDAFRGVAGDTFGFEGRLGTVVVDRTYETTFVADNVVSLTREDDQAPLSKALWGLLAVYGVLTVTFVSMAYILLHHRHFYPIPWILTAPVLGLLFYGAIRTVAAALYWEVGELTVEVPDGSTVSRTFSPSDAASVVNRFGRRGGP